MKIEPKKKRRTPLSCISCRRRKIKCDRSKPVCTRCIKSKLECLYDSPKSWNQIDPVNLNLDKYANKSISFVSSLDPPNKDIIQKNNIGESNFTIIDSTIDDINNTTTSTTISTNNNTISFNSMGKSNFLSTNSFDGSLSNTTQSPILKCKLPSLQNIKIDYDHEDISSTINNNSNNFFVNENYRDNNDMNLSISDKLLEIESLKKRIKSLQESFNQSIDCISLVLDENNSHLASFRTKDDARFICSGTFTGSSIMRRDAFMRNIIIDFHLKKKKKCKNKTNHKEGSLVQKYYPESLSKFNHSLPIKSFEFLQSQLLFKKENLMIPNEESFIQQLQNVIPPWDIVQFYFNYFVKYLYPFIPIIDENIFRMNLSRILIYTKINEAESKDAIKIKLESKLDGIRISMLLIIMRLSYISISTKFEISGKIPSINQQRALSFPINSDIIALVNYSLHHVNFLRKTSVEVLQLILLKRFYQLLSCEDGDGCTGSDGIIFTGLIVSNAKAIGLGKDFGKHNFLNEEKNKLVDNKNNLKHESNSNSYFKMNLFTRGPSAFMNLWKKLWWVSLEFDLSHSMNFGSIPEFNHDPDSCKIGKASFDPFSTGVLNLEVDKLSINRLIQFSNINHQIFELLKILHDVNYKPTVIEVDNKLSEIKSIVESTFDNEHCRKYISPDLATSAKINNTREKIKIYTLLSTIEYYLLLHCELMGDKEEKGLRSESLGLAKDRFSIIFPDLILRCAWIAENIMDIWEKMSGKKLNEASIVENEGASEYSSYIIILAPLINNAYAKIMPGLYSVAIRLISFGNEVNKNKLNDDNNKIKELQKLYQHILILLKTSVVLESKLSKYWYPSLRFYSKYRRFLEWFENLGNLTFVDNSRSMNSPSTQINQKNPIFNIFKDENIENRIVILQNFMLNLKTEKIQEINYTFEKAEEKYGLSNINEIYLSHTFKFEMSDEKSVEVETNSTNTDNDTLPNDVKPKTPLSDIFDNPFSPNVNLNIMDYDLENDEVSDGLKFFESLEMNDWEDVSKWFTQTTPFEQLGIVSFNKDFEAL